MTPAFETTLHDILERSRALGFLGPGSVRVHEVHARGFARGADAPGRFLDLGSGGGVPGLVLAGLWVASEAVLLDASARRCEFLAEAIGALGCADRVSVVRARAEDAGRRDDLRATFELVVARGFGSPAVTAECGAPFLRPGGRLVVSEPPGGHGSGGGTGGRDVDDPRVGGAGRAESGGRRRGADAAPPDAGSRWSATGLAQLGLTAGQAWSEPYHYRSLVLERPCPDRYPRRVGMPAKRPLF